MDTQLLERILTARIVSLIVDESELDIASEFGLVNDIAFSICRDCDLRFFWPPVTGSERFYERLQKIESYYPHDKPEYEHARRYLRDDYSLLEIGCGSGAFGAGSIVQRYVGLEFNPKAVEAARERGLTVLHESVEVHCRSNGEVYDVACAFQVLEHVERPAVFLSSCLATLKPRGLLIISVPSADSFAKDIPNFLLDLPPHHVTRWTDRCLATLEKLFPVKVVSVWHEPLQTVHRRMYIQGALNRYFYGIFGRPVPAVTAGTIGGIVPRINEKLSRVFDPLLKLQPARGISVTVVYQKLA